MSSSGATYCWGLLLPATTGCCTFQRLRCDADGDPCDSTQAGSVLLKRCLIASHFAFFFVCLTYTNCNPEDVRSPPRPSRRLYPHKRRPSKCCSVMQLRHRVAHGRSPQTHREPTITTHTLILVSHHHLLHSHLNTPTSHMLPHTHTHTLWGSLSRFPDL